MGNVKIIAASAGSGKTYRLAYEYVRSVVEDPTRYRRILAVTFTNKATEEMSSRILERLHELATPAMPSPYLEDLMREFGLGESAIRARAKEARGRILHDYSRFAVSTIDRFFQRLVRSFMRELGLDAGFALELETDSLLELAADALIDTAASDVKIRDRIFSAAAERLDEGRRWDVREPLVSLGKELFGEEYRRDFAEDGCGNGPDSRFAASSVIDEVIERAARAQTEMAATARDILTTVGSAGLTADDFKGRSRGVVPWLEKVAAGAFIPLSVAAREAADSDQASAWTVKTSPSKDVVSDMIPVLRPMLEKMDAVYNDNRRLVASAGLLRENRHNFMLLADLQRQIELICREENIVPISETNRMIARLVGGNDTPFIFERAGSCFTHFFIDEFQDTSHSQWENFVPLLRNAVASEPDSPVMLIGDIKQAIYRWRGSDWRILSRRVTGEMGSERVRRETLDVNYRSAGRVVEFNNDAIGRVVAAAGAKLDAMIAEALSDGSLDTAEATELTGMLAEAYRDHTQIPRSDADGGYVTMTVYDADAQGDYVPPVIERIEELQSRGYRAGDIAVLVRSNTQGARVARMILERKLKNPSSSYCYDVVTQDALMVGGSAASRFVIACLSLAAGGAGHESAAGDNSIQRAVYNRWLERDFDAPIPNDEAEFFARIAALSPEDAFEHVVLRFSLAERTADVAYIQALHQQITTFAARSVADIPLFLKWWNEHGAKASITMHSSKDAITVSTIHKAKGLQYKAVIVPWLSWSMAPESRGRPLVLWAEGGGDDGLFSHSSSRRFPINYKEAMSVSHFSARYYREQVMAHIDATNLLYVALTRAEQELHLMTSSNPRDGRGSVGNLLRTVLGITEKVSEWGVPHSVDRGAVCDSDSHPGLPEVLGSYPTARPGAKVRLRLPQTRYTDDDSSRRQFGVSMHRAFERAVTADDVRRTLSTMVADSFVTMAEYSGLKDVVERTLADPLVAGWFGGGWETVRNEGDILIPGMQGTRRPDRVMTRGEKAVVVDYKFGRQTSPSHTDQLENYMHLLGRMGYTDVEGYLWYVSMGKIERVG